LLYTKLYADLLGLNVGSYLEQGLQPSALSVSSVLRLYKGSETFNCLIWFTFFAFYWMKNNQLWFWRPVRTI